MTYTLLKKLIEAENKRVENGEVSTEEHAAWKEQTLNKMDTFLICNRITQTQYNELSEMMV